MGDVSERTVRFRYPGAIAVAGIVAALGAVPLASQSWFLAPILLVPLAVTAFVWRSGTDADAAGLRVRALLGRRRVSWDEVAEIVADPRGRVVARLAGGGDLTLPAVRAADLPRLVAASGHELSRAGSQ
jgi:Bacterial PH domain